MGDVMQSIAILDQHGGLKSYDKMLANLEPLLFKELELP